MIVFALAILLTLPGTSQKDRCKPNGKRGSMACVNRLGHCIAVTVDGQTTLALTEKATAARVHAVPHGQDVCWYLPRPVSTQFRASAVAAGLDPTFLGATHNIDVLLYPLADYDPQVDSRVEYVFGTNMEADGNRNGTWQVRSARPLPAGEYVATFRISGKDNWDRQSVLLTLDPSLQPAPADEGTGPKR
jgi:hypothetical protein